MIHPLEAKPYIKPLDLQVCFRSVIIDAYLILNDPEWNQGYANGYIRVSKEHPWYKECESDYPYIHSSVHGGVTCHAIDRQEGSAVIGFDTRHLGDNPTDQDSAYCIAQVNILALDALEAYTAHKRKIDKIQNMSIEELREELTKCLTI